MELWGFRVLIVEPNTGMLNRLRVDLEREGWIVEGARTAGDAAVRYLGFGADVFVASYAANSRGEIGELISKTGLKGLVYGEAGLSRNGLLEVATTDPTSLVRALRIIEREVQAERANRVIQLADSTHAVANWSN